MKFKKLLAGILSAAMIVTLMPTMAFASSTNTVANVPTVAASDDMPETSVYVQVKDIDGWDNQTQKVKLTFNNGVWKDNPELTDLDTSGSIVIKPGTSGTKATKAVFTSNTVSAISSGTIKVTNVFEGTTKDVTYSFVPGVTDVDDQLKAVAASINGASNRLYDATVNSTDDKLVLTALIAGTITDKPEMTAGSTVTLNEAGGAAATTGDGVQQLSIVTGGTDSVTDAKITKIVSVSDNSIELEFSATTANKDQYFKFTFTKGTLKSGSDDGEVSISIDGLDSKVSSQKLAIATVGSSSTVSTVSGTAKTFPRGTVDASDIKTTIEIRETAINSLKEKSKQVIKLTLPKGVTWNSFNVSGDMAANGTVNVAGAAVADTTSLNALNTAAAGSVLRSQDSRTAYYVFDVTGSADVRNVLNIVPNITISKDTTVGEIAVSLVGLSGKYDEDTNALDSVHKWVDKNTVADTSDLIIAYYGNEGVEVSTTSEVPTFVSGYITDTSDKNFTFKITLKENMVNSLSAGRYVDFDLPEQVQICGPIKAKLNTGSNVTVDDKYIEIKDFKNSEVDDAVTVGGISVRKASTDDTSVFSFMVPDAGNMSGSNGIWKGNAAGVTAGANTITFEVPVTVEAGYAGDITCSVSGSKAGVEDTDVVVAKVESPIKVETKTTDVKNGVQTQVVADVTITENYAGYLSDETDSQIVLNIDTLGLTKGMVFESFDNISVTSGNLELGKCKIGTIKDAANSYLYDGEDVLILPIKHSSTKASTIELKGLTVALNRTLPEGGYDLNIGGSALVENDEYNDTDFDDTTATVEDYVKIVTPADSATVTTKIDAQFVIGATTYTNNGAAVTMDAAAYIDGNSRTMVPVRYIAEACGIKEADITWNQAAQTVTINGANTVITLTMGRSTIVTSTGTINMDTVPVNSNGRIYVPARFIANAFDANVTWDQATKTVGIANK